MTKKNFETAAHLVRTLNEPLAVRRVVADTFAAFFTADNYRFDRARFIDACGLEDDHDAS